MKTSNWYADLVESERVIDGRAALKTLMNDPEDQFLKQYSALLKHLQAYQHVLQTAEQKPDNHRNISIAKDNLATAQTYLDEFKLQLRDLINIEIQTLSKDKKEFFETNITAALKKLTQMRIAYHQYTHRKSAEPDTFLQLGPYMLHVTNQLLSQLITESFARRLMPIPTPSNGKTSHQLVIEQIERQVKAQLATQQTATLAKEKEARFNQSKQDFLKLLEVVEHDLAEHGKKINQKIKSIENRTENIKFKCDLLHSILADEKINPWQLGNNIENTSNLIRKTKEELKQGRPLRLNDIAVVERHLIALRQKINNRYAQFKTIKSEINPNQDARGPIIKMLEWLTDIIKKITHIGNLSTAGVVRETRKSVSVAETKVTHFAKNHHHLFQHEDANQQKQAATVSDTIRPLLLYVPC